MVAQKNCYKIFHEIKPEEQKTKLNVGGSDAFISVKISCPVLLKRNKCYVTSKTRQLISPSICRLRRVNLLCNSKVEKHLISWRTKSRCGCRLAECVKRRFSVLSGQVCFCTSFLVGLECGTVVEYRSHDLEVMGLNPC